MYKLTDNPDTVIRVEDGVTIPRGHRWFAEYETWVAAGNTPIPADTVNYLQPNIAALWQAAHDYEYEQISGSAIGLLTLGVLTGKPKATAVEMWIHSIWALYYKRKAAATGDAPVAPAMLDFSCSGPIPYTVPELMAEMGY